MKFALILAAALVLAGCEPHTSGAPAAPGAGARSGVPLPTGPVLSGVGSLVGVQGKAVTLDHEAVAGGLPAGRHAFVADAAALAEAPLAPGSRVAFSYQDWSPHPLLVELKAR
ncbi:copper-binding protein [Phenylobacterium sp.]|jgi:hypothetical protein|uniref:copper-binding protein n=1 Tax=Phenylobacterium sp. TaxID=1871053 RepID=UPI002F42700B